jgi:hypothetical protein
MRRRGREDEADGREQRRPTPAKLLRRAPNLQLSTPVELLRRAPNHGGGSSLPRWLSLFPCSPRSTGFRDGDDHPAASSPLPRPAPGAEYRPSHGPAPRRRSQTSATPPDLPFGKTSFFFPWRFQCPAAGCFPGNRDGKMDSAAMAYTGVDSLNEACFSTLSPSHHIKYTKRHMFEAVNVGKKITNHTVLLYITSRIF